MEAIAEVKHPKTFSERTLKKQQFKACSWKDSSERNVTHKFEEQKQIKVQQSVQSMQVTNSLNL